MTCRYSPTNFKCREIGLNIKIVISMEAPMNQKKYAFGIFQILKKKLTKLCAKLCDQVVDF